MNRAFTPHLVRFQALLRRLLRSDIGAAAVEFAVISPVIITMGMTGTEFANLATVQMQVSQIAVSVADNASRLGQSDNTSVTPTVTESDVNSVLQGAISQGGALDLKTNGRVILSSLEVDATTGRQYLHWQRCTGSLGHASKYGVQGAGLTGATLNGVGGGTTQIKAPADSAIMVAEVYYQYHGLFGSYFIKQPLLHQEAAFLNRDSRNLGTSSTAGLSPNATASRC